jgi:hypothetical protein
MPQDDKLFHTIMDALAGGQAPAEPVSAIGQQFPEEKLNSGKESGRSLQPGQAHAKESKTAEELAAMILEDLLNFDGSPRRGVKITVYGGKQWQAMLMFGIEAGPVRNVNEIRALIQTITERLQNRYDLAW